MTQAVILAAGKGTRMNATDKNKCLLPLCNKPMIRYPLEALKRLGIEKPIVVVGFAQDSIRQELGNEVHYAFQQEPNGTAKALDAALPLIDPATDEVIVLYGDHSAFYDEHVLQQLLDTQHGKQADMTLVTVQMNNPYGYGRIVRGANGEIVEIVEEKNATEEQRQIKEINSGNGVYKHSFLTALMPQIQMNDLTHEYYLTDIVKLGLGQGYRVTTMLSTDELLSMGVNTPEQYAAAEAVMKSKLKR